MKRLGMLLVVAAMLVTAPSVLAGSSLGSACTSKKVYRSLGLRVHGLSCRAAYKVITRNTTKYTCKGIGHNRRPPFTVKCAKTFNKQVFITIRLAAAEPSRQRAADGCGADLARTVVR